MKHTCVKAYLFFIIIIIISDYCNNIKSLLFLASQVLLPSHNRFVCQTQTSIHNQEHTQNLFISVAHTTRVKADDPVCANPRVSLSTHTTNAHTCVRSSPPPAHTLNLFIHHAMTTPFWEHRTARGPWVILSFFSCLSVCPSLYFSAKHV